MSETKICTDIEAWYKTWCPYCGSHNFHCNGNEQDLSGIDVDAVICRKCKQTYSFMEEEEYENPEEGQEAPG